MFNSTAERIRSTAAMTAMVFAVGVTSQLHAGECVPQWTPEFGTVPGLGGAPWSFAVWDDGSGNGPELYAGGGFTSAGGATAFRMAKWDANSETWSPVGDGMNGEVLALAVYDDGLGGGPALYAAGGFDFGGVADANFIAKWDGTTWSTLGTGMNDAIWALAVHDDGSGPALYAAGRFTMAGGMPANRIARWNGVSWSAVGAGMAANPAGQPPSIVQALAVYDDGSGPALYAGGTFTVAGGIAGVNRIARWDGTFWEAVGFEANNGVNGAIDAMTVYDDGTGEALYVGGGFTEAGGTPGINRVAKWDGRNWSGLGNGLDTAGNEVRTLTVYDDGNGASLYAGGQIGTAEGETVNNIARWDGASWSALEMGVNNVVNASIVFDDGTGSGPDLYVGGFFGDASGTTATNIARWDAGWSSLGSGMNSSVIALDVLDDISGSGSALYAGGNFMTAGGVALTRIGKWDGTSWSPLGTGLDSGPYEMAVWDDGGGPALYAGGTFQNAGGSPANRIAKWDGATWSALGTGMNGEVRSVIVHDDGSGEALYAGGQFQNAGGITARGVARWDGTAWSDVSTGVYGAGNSMVIFDDGSGPALFVGGDFTFAGPGGKLTVNNIAKWDGTVWSALSTGTNNDIWSLAVFDDGSGAALYAGGDFTTAGGVTVNRVAKWDHVGGTWSALGSGMSGGNVRSLAVYNDGAGAALYAAGNFTTAGGNAIDRIAKWDSSSATWSALGDGLGSEVRRLVVFDDSSGEGAALYAGGNFTTSPAGDSYLAKWQGCIKPCTADVAGSGGAPDGVVDALDFLALLAQWGTPCADPCTADFTGPRGVPDGNVDALDFMLLLATFGDCPAP